MIDDNLKKFVLKAGLTPINKTFDGVESLFVGKGEYQDPLLGAVYENGIFIFQNNDNWVIGFNQSAKTRALTFEEVKDAIIYWKESNSLQDYE